MFGNNSNELKQISMNKIMPIIELVLAAVLLYMLILLLTAATSSGSRVSDNRSPATGGVILDSPGNRCQCYCSDKCGPRDRKEGIDIPFVDRETRLCFCAQRDKANYVPNRCTPKIFANSCCG